MSIQIVRGLKVIEKKNILNHENFKNSYEKIQVPCLGTHENHEQPTLPNAKV
jgi:hypothetical protein